MVPNQQNMTIPDHFMDYQSYGGYVVRTSNNKSLLTLK
jgi:hypothetical protein